MKNSKQFFVDDVLDRNHAGWLNCLTQDEIIVPLCYKTKVALVRNDRKGQVVRVLEGKHKGVILKIPFKYQDKHATVSYLSNYTSTIKSPLKVSKQNKTLWIKNVGSFIIDVSSTMHKGKYYLEIPVRPIKKILNPDYYNESIGGSRFAQTWFRLVPEKRLSQDAYLHYGSYSEGCITVVNNRKLSVWNKIYLELIKSRLNDRYIAFLSVI